jgi:hypothetical protein
MLNSFPSFFITVSMNFEAASWVKKNSTTASIDVIPAAYKYQHVLTVILQMAARVLAKSLLKSAGNWMALYVVNDGYLEENEFYESVNGSRGRNWKGKVMSFLVNFSLSRHSFVFGCNTQVTR